MVALGRLVEARFIRRLNRFAALVYISGRETLVHVANSGRMRELLVEGRRVLLAPAAGENRKTAFDLSLVDLGHTLASADARLPNKLVHEAQVQGRLDCFAGYDGIRLEATYGDSRLDMALSGGGGTCLVEVKSVTLVVDDAGIFPDAPTTRGRKHVLTLAERVREGYRGAVVFVVQREDASSVSPNDESDPDFGVALREAVELGVEAYAFRCTVSTAEVTISEQIPVVL